MDSTAAADYGTHTNTLEVTYTEWGITVTDTVTIIIDWPCGTATLTATSIADITVTVLGASALSSFTEFTDDVSDAYGGGSGTDLCGTRTYTLTTSPDFSTYSSLSGFDVTVDANSNTITPQTFTATITGSLDKTLYPNSVDATLTFSIIVN